jgi:hypothetical protein
VPPAQDAEVTAAVAAACAPVPDVVAHRCEAADGAGLNVVLGLRPGLPPDIAQAAAAEVARRLGADGVIVERVEALHLRLRVAGDPAGDE